jgi:Mu-like prophage protein gp29
MAINIENPNRQRLLAIYMDTMIDNHLSGAIGQRKDMVLQKAFKIADAKGIEKPELTTIFESKWFKDLMDYALDSTYYGHSLIELGEIVEGDKRGFSYVKLVPRHHVCPEFGVIKVQASDEANKGISFRDGKIAKWVIEAGRPDDLGLLLKVCPQAIAKRYMLAYWDTFGEIFGMPIRVARTASRDPQERSSLQKILKDMGTAASILVPEGTEIEIKETARGDAYNVYDQRVQRADAEISKCILGQTMTMDNGSSKAQGEVHLEVLKNIINQDADFIKDLVNDTLIPLMINEHGFSMLKGCHFEWDETVDYSPEQQKSIEEMLLQHYDIDPKYFIEKYNIKILGKKENQLLDKGGSFSF